MCLTEVEKVCKRAKVRRSVVDDFLQRAEQEDMIMIREGYIHLIGDLNEMEVAETDEPQDGGLHAGCSTLESP